MEIVTSPSSLLEPRDTTRPHFGRAALPPPFPKGSTSSSVMTSPIITTSRALRTSEENKIQLFFFPLYSTLILRIWCGCKRKRHTYRSWNRALGTVQLQQAGKWITRVPAPTFSSSNLPGPGFRNRCCLIYVILCCFFFRYVRKKIYIYNIPYQQASTALHTSVMLKTNTGEK